MYRRSLHHKVKHGSNGHYQATPLWDGIYAWYQRYLEACYQENLPASVDGFGDFLRYGLASYPKGAKPNG